MSNPHPDISEELSKQVQGLSIHDVDPVVADLIRHINNQSLKLTSAQKASLATHLLLSSKSPDMWTSIDTCKHRTQETLLTQLPLELVQLIASYLDLQSLYTARRVCRSWRNVMDNMSLWRFKYISDYYLNDVEEGMIFGAQDPEFVQGVRVKALRARHFTGTLENQKVSKVVSPKAIPRDTPHDSTTIDSPVVPALAPWELFTKDPGPSAQDLKLQKNSLNLLDWKLIYRQRSLIEQNWINKRFVSKTLHGHHDGIYSLQFDADKIVTGSRDHSVKIWDIATGKCIKTLEKHTQSVLCVQYDDKYLVTGSSDHSMVIWDMQTYRVLHTCEGHADSVLNLLFNRKRSVDISSWPRRCKILNTNMNIENPTRKSVDYTRLEEAGVIQEAVFTASKDNSIRVWDMQTGKCHAILNGHHAAVNSLDSQGDILVSGSGDRVVRVWNLKTGVCDRELVGHERGIAVVAVHGDTVVSGCSDKTVKLWNLHTGQQLKSVVAHTDLIRTLEFNGRWIFTGSYDMQIKMWDAKTLTLICELQSGHRERIYKLQFSRTKLVSCSQDRQVNIWDFGKLCDGALFE